MIEIITGDILDATEKYILHQTNCVSTGGAAGVAKSIFEKYPYANCYADRVKQSKPGTIDIRGNGNDQRFIINLHGQVYPGSSKYAFLELDGAEIRESYFYEGLLYVTKINSLESIALPWKIGCGLGGGNWDNYLEILNSFADFVNKKQGTKVVIYRRDGD